MAQLDIYRDPSGSGLVLDCQSDVVSALETRLVAPLMSLDEAPASLGLRLNPRFVVAGASVVLVTQFASAMLRSELHAKVGALHEDHRDSIIAAFDFLLTGV